MCRAAGVGAQHVIKVILGPANPLGSRQVKQRSPVIHQRDPEACAVLGVHLFDLTQHQQRRFVDATKVVFTVKIDHKGIYLHG